MAVFKSIVLFFFAAFLEIGGGYLIWLSVRSHRPAWWCVGGGLMLTMYGIAATYQFASFGRVYAAYGGVFMFVALFWAWKIDNFQPDKWDFIGTILALTGACIIMFVPRK